MITATDDILEVGKRYGDTGKLCDENGKAHIIPFLVIREVSRDDYIEFCATYDKRKAAEACQCLFFYEISVD